MDRDQSRAGIQRMPRIVSSLKILSICPRRPVFWESNLDSPIKRGQNALEFCPQSIHDTQFCPRVEVQ